MDRIIFHIDVNSAFLSWTAVILNEARRLIPEVWDGVTPLCQVGLGVSKLTHDMPLTLFEDEKMEYYRQWDADYDKKMEEQEKKDRHYRDGRSKSLKGMSWNFTWL